MSQVKLTNFTVSVVFLYGVIFGEADPSHPFDAFRRSQSCNLKMKIKKTNYKQLKQAVFLCQWVWNPTSAAKYFAMQASLMKGLPASLRRAALYVSSRAASICVATWAIWCCIPCDSKTCVTTPLNTPSRGIRLTGAMQTGNWIHLGASPGSQRCAFQTGSSAWCKERCGRSSLVRGQASESQHTWHRCCLEWRIASINLMEMRLVLPGQRFQSCPRSAFQWHTCTRDRSGPECSSPVPADSTKLTLHPCKTYV